MTQFVADTWEGRAVADALVVIGNCLHQISMEGTGRFRWTPTEWKDDPKRTPTDFLRRAMTHLLERYRIILNLTMNNMYIRDEGSHPYDKAMRKAAE